MRYEVTCMTYELDWDNGLQEQCFASKQYKTLEEAWNAYDLKKMDIEVEHVSIAVILDEFSR
jgi:hypothetical protein